MNASLIKLNYVIQRLMTLKQDNLGLKGLDSIHSSEDAINRINLIH